MKDYKIGFIHGDGQFKYMYVESKEDMLTVVNSLLSSGREPKVTVELCEQPTYGEER